MPFSAPPVETPRESRAPYRPPRLVVFGHVEALTLANFGGVGKNDMAGGPAKTGF